jgi:DNA-binding XRE family transcriptional regulator
MGKIPKTDELRAARARLGWSQEKVAKRLGYSSTTSYSDIENGVRTPKIETMIDIAKLFNGQVRDFFNIEIDYEGEI